jgi:outer membrane lipoprotein
MKRTRLLLVLLGASMLLFSCAPVLDRSLMKEAVKNVSFRALRERPDEFKGRLFVLGGVIVKARLTAEGSQIEALHVPVDSSGYFSDQGRSEGRYLAVLPKDDEILDPEIYRQGRRVTLAGRFIGLHREKIEEMEYVYPLFRIEQIYLWPKDTYYAPGYYGYYYDPWMYPYPYYYGDIWWGYPYYPYYYPGYYPYYYRGYPPAYGYPYQRVPSPERTPAPERAPAPAPAPQRR